MKDRYLKISRDGLSLYDRHKLLDYPEITDAQAEQMLHALGADSKPYRKYLDRKYYHAYRNYYDAGGEDVELWNDLESKGLADHERFYHVTVKGIRLLEFLTQCRIYDNYQNVADARTNVLKAMIRRDVFCGYGCWFPTPAWAISLDVAIPEKLALDTLKQLCEEGYVYKGHYGEMDEDGYVHCSHGWYCTSKCKDLEIYGVYQQEEYAKINKMIQER